MSDDAGKEPAGGGPVDGQRHGYQPPVLQRLGTVADLTKGGALGPSDGLGGAGDEGSL